MSGVTGRGALPRRPPGQPEQSGQLHDQQQGKPETEIPVPGLVAEDLHPQDTAQRSAQKDGEEQAPLSDTLLF